MKLEIPFFNRVWHFLVISWISFCRIFRKRYYGPFWEKIYMVFILLSSDRLLWSLCLAIDKYGSASYDEEEGYRERFSDERSMRQEGKEALLFYFHVVENLFIRADDSSKSSSMQRLIMLNLVNHYAFKETDKGVYPEGLIDKMYKSMGRMVDDSGTKIIDLDFWEFLLKSFLKFPGLNGRKTLELIRKIIEKAREDAPRKPGGVIDGHARDILVNFVMHPGSVSGETKHLAVKTVDFLWSLDGVLSRDQTVLLARKRLLSKAKMKTAGITEEDIKVEGEIVETEEEESNIAPFVPDSKVATG